MPYPIVPRTCRAPGALLLAFWLMSAAAAPAQPAPPAATNPPPPAATLAELRDQIARHVSRSNFDAALFGVKVISVDTGKTLYETKAGKLFSPASNTKLYTVALALDRLGADYRIKTSLLADAPPAPDGTLAGDLILYGRGDPSINARLHGGDVNAALEPLVAALTNAGVRRITGDLVGDTSFLRGAEFGSGWCWDDQEESYGAEISALTINDNTFPVSLQPGAGQGAPCSLEVPPIMSFMSWSNRVVTAEKDARRAVGLFRQPGQNVVYLTGWMPAQGAALMAEIPFHNPAQLFVLLFKEALARHGIVVAGSVRTVGWMDRATGPLDIHKLVELGAAESLPMRDLAREVLKPSQNLYADLLLAQVGEKRRATEPPSARTSEALGIRELDQFLGRVGIPRGEVFFEEGSGLSRNNLATPAATVALLRFMNRHEAGAAYEQALPVAGVDGTLRNRMRNTPAAGQVRAKTGTLRWANSLSGYVTSAAGERLAFSLMLNRYAAGSQGPSAGAELDAIAVMLASFRGRSE